MKRVLSVLAVLLFLLPLATHAEPASTLFANRALIVATSSPGNAYALGFSTLVAGSVSGDLSAFGGRVAVTAPVHDDALLVGGSVTDRSSIGGDLRAIGGTVDIASPIGGDFAVFGYSVTNQQPVGGDVIIAAADASLAGAAGSVTIYGNNVALSGTYRGNVTITAAGRVSLMASTTIDGSLMYRSPDEASIPESATVKGGISYHSTLHSFGNQSSHILSFISLIVFIAVRILGALVLAGLVAGLFPFFATRLVTDATEKKLGAFVLTVLIGFAVLVAAPILCLLLTLTFIGIGIALLLFILYLLLIVLAILYAGILIGGVIVREFWHRSTIRWYDGVLGMFIFSLITLIPVVGTFIASILVALSAGLLVIFFVRRSTPTREREVL